MIMDDNDGQMIFGDLGAYSFLTFVLQLRENPEKTSPRKLVPTRDRTRARCVTGAQATTCPTAVDSGKLTYFVDVLGIIMGNLFTGNVEQFKYLGANGIKFIC